jgi:hypothetical protein
VPAFLKIPTFDTDILHQLSQSEELRPSQQDIKGSRNTLENKKYV